METASESIEKIKSRLEVASSLHSIVKTMKLFSLVHIYQYERAVESLADYFKATEMGLDVLLSENGKNNFHRKRKTSGLVIGTAFGSDQGLCGRLNEQIAQEAVTHLENQGVRKNKRCFIVVGYRLKDQLECMGETIVFASRAPASVTGINRDTLILLEELEKWQNNSEVESINLYFNRHLSKTSCEPMTQHFLPVELETITSSKKNWTWHTLPKNMQSKPELLKSLIRQYIFISLYRAFAESLASENAARLAAMQNAEQNIKNHLDDLQQSFYQKRQTTITEELLDVVSGFESMVGKII